MSTIARWVRGPWRLRTYMAGLVVLVMVGAGAAAFYTASQARDNARTDALGDASYAGKTAAAALSGGITELQTAFAQIAPNGDVTQFAAQPGACGQGWTKIGVFTSGHIDAVRSDGTVICTSRPSALGPTPNYAGERWLTRTGSGPVTFAPITDAATGKPSLVLAWSIRGGAIAVFLDLESAGTQLASFAGPSRAEILVTNAGDRRVLLRSVDPAKWTGVKLAGTPFTTTGNAERPDVSGHDRIYASTTVAPLGWTLYAGADSAVAVASSENLYRNSLLLIGAMLALALVAALVIQRRITGPIRKLRRAVITTAPRAGGAAIAVHGPAEIVELAEGFNTVMAAVGTELTERRRAEAAARAAEESLRESERTYRLLFESNPLPMWVYDTDTLRFLRVNDAAVDRYGYTREQFLAMTIRDIRPAEDIPLAEASARESATVQRSGPWRHLTRDGTEISVEITSHPIEMDGRRTRMVMSEDVTERERLQQQLQQSQRLESLGQLAGGVAHDFNNLLAVIMNYSGFVKASIAEAETADGKHWQPVREDVEQIELASQRAAALVHQLLAFARREVVKPKVLDLDEVVTGIEPLLRRSVGEHITVHTTTVGDLWPILADPGQLEQVLVNLAVNARDAMPDGGTLAIETHNLDVDDEYASSRPGLAPGRYVRLRVSDTGAGMDQITLQRVFEPFFTTKEKGRGTGLGLATVYGIISQAGGNAQMYSEPGFGTTFTALFPATQQAGAAESVPAAGAPVTSNGETVLVVEDEDAIREVARRILSRHGYNVLTASRGGEALALARSHPGEIHLLLSDVVMPEMLGKEVALIMAQLRPGIRVLFMSGYAQDVMDGNDMLSVHAGLVEKPFSEAALLGQVAEALSAQAVR